MTNLKRIIDEKGVQQRWLAEQVGVTEVSMSRYVSGDRIPKAPMAIRMADALGVDVKELYGWDDAHVIGTGEDMTTEEAAEVLRNAAWLGTDADRKQIEEAVEMAINALTAQEQLVNNSPELDNNFGDLISRQAAIDALKEAFNPSITNFVKAKIALDKLPSAQPEIKPIDYRDCSNALLRMWMDKVITDGEYNRIMDKLNSYWRRTDG